MKKYLLAAAALAALGISVAVAQLNTNPTRVTAVGIADLFQDIVAGTPQPYSTYATAQQINNVDGYQKSTPSTALTVPSMT